MRNWIAFIMGCLSMQCFIDHDISIHLNAIEKHQTILAQTTETLSGDVKDLAGKVKDLDYQVEVLAELQRNMK